MKPSKLSQGFIWLIGWALASCGRLSSVGEGGLPTLLEFSATKAASAQNQAPWHLQIQCLSESQLRGASKESGPANSRTTTVAIKLRIQGQDAQAHIADLLQEQAPTYSPAQAQEALFYHMGEAGYLQLAGQSIRPITAYVEMTPQRDQCLDIVFVFALSRPALTQISTVSFIVDKAFFLSQPVEFNLPTAQLLPAS